MAVPMQDGASPPRRELPGPAAWERAGAILSALLALGFVAMFVGMALLRVRYPFALEWVEGGVLQGVNQLVAGRPLFAEPTLQYIPFNYPPLYYYVCAPLAKLMGGGFLPLRLVSFAATLGCFALIAVLVWHETRDALATLLAVGMYAATYEMTAVWFDLARADSLHVLLLLAGFAWLRMDRSWWRGALASGLLFGLAFLAKQSAITSTAPLAAYLLVTRPRVGLVFSLAMTALVVGSTFAFDAASGGWYRYYIFLIPAGSPAHLAWLPYFWIHDAGRMGFALAVGAAYVALAPRGRSPGAVGDHAWWALGLLVSCWWVRLYSGAGENNVMPIAAGAAVLFGLGWHEVTRRCREARQSTWAALFHGAVVMQFLGLGYFPPKFLPTARDEAAGHAVVERIRAIPGEVLLPLHPYLAVMAGKPETFHGMAQAAVMFSGKGAAAKRVEHDYEQAVREHRYAAIFHDLSMKKLGDTTAGYRLEEALFENSDAFWTLCGARTRPELIYVPVSDSAR